MSCCDRDRFALASRSRTRSSAVSPPVAVTKNNSPGAPGSCGAVGTPADAVGGGGAGTGAGGGAGEGIGTAGRAGADTAGATGGGGVTGGGGDAGSEVFGGSRA